MKGYLIFVLTLASITYINSSPFHFFEVNDFLFATRNGFVWSVDLKNESINYMELTFTNKPFSLPKELVNFVTNSGLKFIFEATFDINCSLLFVVNQNRQYQSWKITSQPNHKQFKLESNFYCSPFPSNGKLNDIEEWNPMFEKNQSNFFILSHEDHTQLTILNQENAMNVDLTKWKHGKKFYVPQPHNMNITEDVVHSLLGNRYMIKHNLKTGQQDACILNSTIKLSSSLNQCMNESSHHVPLIIFGKNHIENNYYIDGTTQSLGKKQLITMLIIVIAVVVILVILYTLAATYICQDSGPEIPIAGIDAKYLGKIQSASSIKTINDEEFEQSVPQENVKPVPTVGKLSKVSKRVAEQLRKKGSHRKSSRKHLTP
ncbi:hypothetical protein RDWZM_000003 [Blomia tropicalis]|uniref:Uncharacterized protein n=1 Tax=Blomia tropicalis TaxID=40697 RepID=A0A9Q0MA12_BLOTA|nr:hypothetical protein RDWZM_000003 [Blomia tropicalis]